MRQLKKVPSEEEGRVQLARFLHVPVEELWTVPSQIQFIRDQRVSEWPGAWLAEGEFREIDSAFEPPVERVLVRYCLLIHEELGTLLAHVRNEEWVPIWHLPKSLTH